MKYLTLMSILFLITRTTSETIDTTWSPTNIIELCNGYTYEPFPWHKAVGTGAVTIKEIFPPKEFALERYEINSFRFENGKLRLNRGFTNEYGIEFVGETRFNSEGLAMSTRTEIGSTPPEVYSNSYEFLDSAHHSSVVKVAKDTRRETYRYDELGNKVYQLDEKLEDGKWIQRREREWQYQGDTVVSKKEYNIDGDRKWLYNWEQYHTDSSASGTMVEIEQRKGVNATPGYHRTYRNAAGLIDSVTIGGKKRREKTIYVYDSTGSLEQFKVEQFLRDGSLSKSRYELWYSMDNAGRRYVSRAILDDQQFKITRSYHPDGVVLDVAVRWPLEFKSPSEHTARTDTTEYVYDTHGRLRSLKTGEWYCDFYDDLMNRNQLHEFTYDEQGRPTSFTTTEVYRGEMRKIQKQFTIEWGEHGFLELPADWVNEEKNR